MRSNLVGKLAKLRDYAGYLKQGAARLLPGAKVYTRGGRRAALRRQAREAGVRWRRANEESLPFRMKKVAAIEKARIRRGPKA